MSARIEKIQKMTEQLTRLREKHDHYKETGESNRAEMEREATRLEEEITRLQAELDNLNDALEADPKDALERELRECLDGIERLILLTDEEYDMECRCAEGAEGFLARLMKPEKRSESK